MAMRKADKILLGNIIATIVIVAIFAIVYFGDASVQTLIFSGVLTLLSGGLTAAARLDATMRTPAHRRR